jgi:hypothetical protein
MTADRVDSPGVPTKPQFLEVQEVAEAFADLPELVELRNTYEHKHTELISHSKEVAEVVASAVANYGVTFEQLPACEWLISQHAFKAGWSKLQGRKRSAKLPGHADRLQLAIQQSADVQEAFRRLRIDRHYAHFSRGWLTQFLRHLHDYYYGDPQLEKYLAKQYEIDVRVAIEALMRINATATHSVYSRAAERLARDFGRFNVRRNSRSKSAELKFAESCVKLNLSIFGVPKPDAIAEFMLLPGFKRAFDARHIARVAATIRADRRAAREVTSKSGDPAKNVMT